MVLEKVKQLFGAGKVETQAPLEEEVIEETQPLIDSKVIAEDMQSYISRIVHKEDLESSQIKDLQKELEIYRESNAELFAKISRLERLGLDGTPSVAEKKLELEEQQKDTKTKIQNLEKHLNARKELQKLTEEYSLKYPGYKFVPDRIMHMICNKYKLVMGEACMYGREIPEENLDIISQFESEINDSRQEYILILSEYSRDINECRVERNSKGHMTIHGNSGGSHVGKVIKSNFKITAPLDHFRLPTLPEYVAKNRLRHLDNFKSSDSVKLYKKCDRTNRLIPGLSEEDKERIKVLDPIASLKVNGGHIIMTAWDEEAKIPEIQNTNLN